MERLRSHAQRGGGLAVGLPWPSHNTLPPPISLSEHSPIHKANAEALRNFVKIETNLSKQSSGDADLDTRDSGAIEAEERFSSDRRTLSADGRLGWVLESLVARGAWLARRLELRQGWANLVIAIVDKLRITAIGCQGLSQSEQVLSSIVARHRFGDDFSGGLDPLVA